MQPWEPWERLLGNVENLENLYNWTLGTLREPWQSNVGKLIETLTMSPWKPERHLLGNLYIVTLGALRTFTWKTWEFTSSTRTRRGGSCLKDKYKTFLIYRTCMRRAPAKPVRACTLRKWCPVSHVTFEAPLRPSHFSLHSSHSTLHTSHFTLHTSHFTLHSSQSTLHTSHSTLHTSHFTLLTSHFTLHSPHFTLHTSHCTLHTPHFISSELFSPYPSWALLISSLLVCRSLDAATPILFTRSSHATGKENC